ncbi:hypothetical protein [Dactylosporangium darangshiense]|uniref:hypothetical protein n=1 Tax=Dactylosporangium darangshiense TaxID=579108 RepID=UPI00363228A9
MLRAFLLEELRLDTGPRPGRLGRIHTQLAKGKLKLPWLQAWVHGTDPGPLELNNAGLLWAIARVTGPEVALSDGIGYVVSAAIGQHQPGAALWALLRDELRRPLGAAAKPWNRGRADAARVLLDLAVVDAPAPAEPTGDQDVAPYLEGFEIIRARLDPAGPGPDALLTAVVGALLGNWPERLPDEFVRRLEGYAAGPSSTASPGC